MVGLIKLEVNPRKMRRVANNLMPAVMQRMAQAHVAYMSDFKKSLIAERMSGRPGVHRRSGSLVKSLDVKHTVGQRVVRGFLFFGKKKRIPVVGAVLTTSSRYFNIHDRGGIVRGNPFLWIRMGRLKDAPFDPVNWRNTFTIPRSDGFLVFEKIGGSPQLIFAVKRKVRIPRRINSAQLFRRDRRRRRRFFAKRWKIALRTAKARIR